MIRDRSLLALLGAELVSRLGSQFTTLFAAIGLHTTFAVTAVLGTFATVNFVVTALPMVGARVAQEAA